MDGQLGSLYFDCTNTATNGYVLQVDASGNLVTGPLPRSALSPDLIGAEHIAGLDSLLFGFPNDGNFVADGLGVMPGAPATSSGDWQSGHSYSVSTQINP